MDPASQSKLNSHKVCELCSKHDPMVKNYAEDYELQTALQGYVQKTTGERINTGDIAHLCDACYSLVNTEHEEEEE